MTDRPIIFSAPMVRALLDGRKTMTRRLAWRPNGKPSFWQRVEPGDRLWVREAWQFMGGNPPPTLAVLYRIDGDDGTTRWRPSIHMPRWASRITLTVTAVKVERLQEISEDDAVAEGIQEKWTCLNPGTGSYARENDTLDDFRALWESLHGPGSWATNPEVVALTFDVARLNIDAEGS